MANPELDDLINGSMPSTVVDRELIDLFEKFETGLKPMHLKSQLNLLKDVSVPDDMRVVARQEIVIFLYKMIHRLGQSVVMEYVEYLNRLPEVSSS